MKYDNLDKTEIIKSIFDSIKKNDLINIYKLIKLNAIDINGIYKIDKKIGIYSLFFRSKKFGKFEVIIYTWSRY